MLNSLKSIERKKVQDNRNWDKGLFLDRAERVSKFSNEILEKIFNYKNFIKIGNYFDTNALYEKYCKYLNVNEDQLLITNGAEEAIRCIFNIILKINDNIMFVSPTYGMYHVFNRMYETNSVVLDYKDFKINKEKLYANLEKIKVFFLPNPSHIEDLFNEEDITNICKILEKNDGYLVVDETYFGFGSESMIKLINKMKNIFIIRSFSKTFGLPSIRVGCLIGNNKNMNVISNYRPAYEISYQSLKISEYFLDNIKIVDDYIHECIEGREYLIKELEYNNIIYNGNNNYLLNIKIDNEEICNSICKNLEENYIYVRDCKKYISITIGPINYMKTFFENFLNLYKKFTIKGEF